MMGLREYGRHRERLGLPGATLGAVQAAIKSGRLSSSLTKDGKIRSAKAADAEWEATTHTDRIPITGPTSPKGNRAALEDDDDPVPRNDLGAARARREAAVAKLAEIELAEKQGSLVRAADVEGAWADIVLRSQTKVLGVVPRLRERHPALERAVLADLEEFIRDALVELAEPTTE